MDVDDLEHLWRDCETRPKQVINIKLVTDDDDDNDDDGDAQRI